MQDNTNKLTNEYTELLKNTVRVWLRIRLTPGMEMLAQELGNGRKPYMQDWVEPEQGLPTQAQLPMVFSPSPVSPSPASPSPGLSPDPTNRLPTGRRRVGHWQVDATGAFPTLFLPEDRVYFYSNTSELKQALNEQKEGDFEKIIINQNNVVCIEKVLVRSSYMQNSAFSDVLVGERGKEPSTKVTPLSILEPKSIPILHAPEEELFFKVEPAGGCGPYNYFMTGQPSDIWISEDGWVRGFIEEDQWPTVHGTYRQFSIIILVEDSSNPKQTAGLELRYRLFPRTL